jgi:TPR repeat protein
MIANLYEKGVGVAKDAEQALAWMKRSAEGGYVVAEFSIGDMYASGKGLPKDPVLGYMWLDLASKHATQTDIVDATVGAFARAGRDLWAAEMTPEQIADAKQRVSEWKPRP